MSDYVQSLARGLAVIRSFSASDPRQTLSDVARNTGLTRATARRLLLTLESLGYVSTDGKHFELTPRVLDLGYSYISSLRLDALVQPFLERFSEEVNESSSVSVLDGTDVVYVARVPTKRIMTVAIGLGSRFPAFQTSMGRVLLAALPDSEVARLFAEADRSRPTKHTVGTADDLLNKIADVRRQGWALVDQELEIGVRSVAAPLIDASGRTVAAMNVSTHVGRTTLEQLRREFVPRLVETAAEINSALARR